METFQDIIQGELPVLVDFFATWCGPCKAIAPTVEEIGKEMQGKARVIKIDIDKNEQLADHYQIQVVPTFILFKKGEVMWRFSGVTDKMTLVQQITNHL